MSKGKGTADWYRRTYQDISGSLLIGTGTTTPTLVTGKASHTIYIQAVRFAVITSAAQSVTYQDNNSSAVTIGHIANSPTVDTVVSETYGDVGVPLTEGKNFVATLSAAGLAGVFSWEGYLKPTATLYA